MNFGCLFCLGDSILSLDSVVEPSGCLYNVCYMLDIMIEAMGLPKIYNLQALLICLGLVQPRRVK